MNKSIVLIAIATLVYSFIFIGCDNAAKKVENAENNVTEAKAELKDARAEYMKDVENYRRQTADQLEANNKSIEQFNLSIAKEKAQTKDAYNKQIAELELRNRELQKRMDEYNGDSKDQWDQFKSEFKRDMDQLGIALSNLTVKNSK